MTNRREFLRQTALFNAIGAAFQRNTVYSVSAISFKKDELKRDLARRLRKIEGQYGNVVSSEKHVRTISATALEMSHQYASILHNGRFRVGTAQKAVNIYLKLLWSYGWIPEPPHCPIDSIVLAEIGDTQTKWTRMEGITAYRNVIDAIRKHIARTAPGRSLSEWELDVWNNRRRQGVQPAVSREGL